MIPSSILEAPSSSGGGSGAVGCCWWTHSYSEGEAGGGAADALETVIVVEESKVAFYKYTVVDQGRQDKSDHLYVEVDCSGVSQSLSHGRGEFRADRL